MPRLRNGTSLVEILIAVSIMAAALAPIIAIFSHTHSQIQSEKAEATVATFASSVMGDNIYKKDYDEVTSGGDTVVIDGTTIKWNLSVQPVGGVTVAFQRVKYHDPNACPGSAELLAAEMARPIAEIDQQYGGDVMKTLVLTIEWGPPGEPFVAGDPKRTIKLVCRKARLK